MSLSTPHDAHLERTSSSTSSAAASATSAEDDIPMGEVNGGAPSEASDDDDEDEEGAESSALEGDDNDDSDFANLHRGSSTRTSFVHPALATPRPSSFGINTTPWPYTSEDQQSPTLPTSFLGGFGFAPSSPTASVTRFAPSATRFAELAEATAGAVNGGVPSAHSNTANASEYDWSSTAAAANPSAVAADGDSIPLSPTPAATTTLSQPPIIPASSLPHEIVLHILRLLPLSSLAPALLVCKAWCQCGVELLWHKPALATPNALHEFLKVLSSPDQTFPYSSFVKRLNLSPLASVIDDRVLSLLSTCTRIERLTLGGCKDFTPGGLAKFLRASAERLVALDLTDVVETNDEVVGALAESCKRLQGLNLSGCKNVTDRGVEMVAVHCPALRRMKLRNIDSLTDTPIILLSLNCPLLLELDLIGCSSVTSIALQQLWRTSFQLRELSLHTCQRLTETAFPPNPASLSNPHFNPHNLLTSPPLEKLETSLDDGRTVPHPTELFYAPPLKTFEHLRFLDLTAMPGLTDDAVAGIVAWMPRIRNLIVAKCTALTDEAVISICGLGKYLHYLHMGHVAAITDRAVMKLARSCTRMRYIDLACCNLLTDMTVFELAQHVPRLKRIGLVRVNQLSDDAIHALFQRTTLERIHLSYCDNVSVQAIHELLQSLHRLTHLSLTGVPAFRDPELQKFCRKPPPDFNSHQRASFCVYSGQGVIQLRSFLAHLADDDGVIPPPVVLPPPNQGQHGRLPRAMRAAAAAAAAVGFPGVARGTLVQPPPPFGGQWNGGGSVGLTPGQRGTVNNHTVAAWQQQQPNVRHTYGLGGLPPPPTHPPAAPGGARPPNAVVGRVNVPIQAVAANSTGGVNGGRGRRATVTAGNYMDVDGDSGESSAEEEDERMA